MKGVSIFKSVQDYQLQMAQDKANRQMTKYHVFSKCKISKHNSNRNLDLESEVNKLMTNLYQNKNAFQNQIQKTHNPLFLNAQSHILQKFQSKLLEGNKSSSNFRFWTNIEYNQCPQKSQSPIKKEIQENLTSYSKHYQQVQKKQQEMIQNAQDNLFSYQLQTNQASNIVLVIQFQLLVFLQKDEQIQIEKEKYKQKQLQCKQILSRIQKGNDIISIPKNLRNVLSGNEMKLNLAKSGQEKRLITNNIIQLTEDDQLSQDYYSEKQVKHQQNRPQSTLHIQRNKEEGRLNSSNQSYLERQQEILSKEIFQLQEELQKRLRPQSFSEQFMNPNQNFSNSNMQQQAENKQTTKMSRSLIFSDKYQQKFKHNKQEVRQNISNLSTTQSTNCTKQITITLQEEKQKKIKLPILDKNQEKILNNSIYSEKEKIQNQNNQYQSLTNQQEGKFDPDQNIQFHQSQIIKNHKKKSGQKNFINKSVRRFQTSQLSNRTKKSEKQQSVYFQKENFENNDQQENNESTPSTTVQKNPFRQLHFKRKKNLSVQKFYSFGNIQYQQPQKIIFNTNKWNKNIKSTNQYISISRLEEIFMIKNLSSKTQLQIEFENNQYFIKMPKIKAKQWTIVDYTATISQISSQQFKNKTTTQHNIDHQLQELVNFNFVSKQGKQVKEIASLTKIMTCYTIINLIENLNISYKQIYLKVSKNAAQTIGTTANLRTNYVLTIEDLLYGLMLPSGNDAAVCLSQYFGKIIYDYNQSQQQETHSTTNKNSISNWLIANNIKSLSTIVQNIDQYQSQNMQNQTDKEQSNRKDWSQYFIFEMNKIARKLKLKNSNFSNPHGLINNMNVSTSEDICKLSFYALQKPLFRQLVSTNYYKCTIKKSMAQKQIMSHLQSLIPSYSYSQLSDFILQIKMKNEILLDEKFMDLEIQWKNTNKLLNICEKIHQTSSDLNTQAPLGRFSGIKTGVTEKAGSCLCTSYKFSLQQKINQQIQEEQKEIIIVVLDAKTKYQRFTDTLKLLKWTLKVFGQNLALHQFGQFTKKINQSIQKDQENNKEDY